MIEYLNAFLAYGTLCIALVLFALTDAVTHFFHFITGYFWR